MYSIKTFNIDQIQQLHEITIANTEFNILFIEADVYSQKYFGRTKKGRNWNSAVAQETIFGNIETNNLSSLNTTSF